MDILSTMQDIFNFSDIVPSSDKWKYTQPIAGNTDKLKTTNTTNSGTGILKPFDPSSGQFPPKLKTPKVPYKPFDWKTHNEQFQKEMKKAFPNGGKFDYYDTSKPQPDAENDPIGHMLYDEQAKKDLASNSTTLLDKLSGFWDSLSQFDWKNFGVNLLVYSIIILVVLAAGAHLFHE